MNLSKDDLVRIQTAVMAFIDMHHDAARIARQTGDTNEEAAVLQDVVQYENTKNKIDELIRTGNIEPRLDFEVDNRDLSETWLHVEGVGRLEVNPMELVLNAVANTIPENDDILRITDPLYETASGEVLDMGLKLVRAAMIMFKKTDDYNYPDTASRSLNEYIQVQVEDIVQRLYKLED